METAMSLRKGYLKNVVSSRIGNREVFRFRAGTVHPETDRKLGGQFASRPKLYKYNTVKLSGTIDIGSKAALKSEFTWDVEFAVFRSQADSGDQLKDRHDWDSLVSELQSIFASRFPGMGKLEDDTESNPGIEEEGGTEDFEEHVTDAYTFTIYRPPDEQTAYTITGSWYHET